MTYNEAYNKIIDAYFKNELQPFSGEFCFCGTLSHEKYSWITPREGDSYTIEEYNRMEKALYLGLVPLGLIILPKRGWETSTNSIINYQGLTDHPNYEDALFQGMSAALDVLKDIHEKRGENTDTEIQFTKRKLTTV